MTTIRQLAALGLGLLALAGVAAPADAASFDCRPYHRARSCPETIVCSTPELSRMDDRVARLYNVRLRALSFRQAARLTDEQRDWLDSRNACGCNASCILRHYETRIEDLRHYE
jgi:uncharacterized protein